MLQKIFKFISHSLKYKNDSDLIIKNRKDNPNTNRQRIKNPKNKISLAVYDFFIRCRRKNIIVHKIDFYI